MCDICGCSQGPQTLITDLQKNAHVHVGAQDHGHSHGDHGHDHDHSTTIQLSENVLAKNQLQAARNQGWFEGRDILALNLMSSPGAGKTTLLERTIRDVGVEFGMQVIEGDQATTHDAERIRATGCPVIQINTGAGCHLEAEMIHRAVQQLDPPPKATLIIENVGNLICPALFDLGERAKVVIASVTEGEDKPLKYPHMFRAADLVILSKIDLLPHLTFDIKRFEDALTMVNPSVPMIQISATSGSGLDAWYNWLRVLRKA